MSLLVSTAVDEVSQELNLIGQQLDSSDIFLYLTRAINYFSSTYSFPTAKKSQDILFFPGVREYQLNSDVGTIIEPQRSPFFHSPRFQHETSRELSHWPYGNLTALEYDGATPYLVANVDSGNLFLVESCDSTDDLVSVTGDASTATLDELIYTQGTGSLRFTVTASGGTTTITFGVDAFDITDLLTKNYAFLDLGCPATNTANITSVALRMGNDSSNYYTMSATTRYRGQAIGPGFGLIGFDLTSATEVGSVTDTAIDYVAVIITTPLSGVNGVYHLDNIFLSQGTFFQLPYYSSKNIDKHFGQMYSEWLSLTEYQAFHPKHRHRIYF